MSKISNIEDQRSKNEIREMLGIPDLKLTATEDVIEEVVKVKKNAGRRFVAQCGCGCTLFRLSYDFGPVCHKCGTHHPDWMDYD